MDKLDMLMQKLDAVMEFENSWYLHDPELEHFQAAWTDTVDESAPRAIFAKWPDLYTKWEEAKSRYNELRAGGSGVAGLGALVTALVFVVALAITVAACVVAYFVKESMTPPQAKITEEEAKRIDAKREYLMSLGKFMQDNPGLIEEIKTLSVELAKENKIEPSPVFKSPIKSAVVWLVILGAMLLAWAYLDGKRK